MKKQNKGFTMIELLVVIAIIGILSATAAPKLIKEVRKGTVAKVQHNLGIIRSKLSHDEALSDEFPDLAGEDGGDNTNLLKTYSIGSTPPFTDEEGKSHVATSQVVDSRTNEGGWVYDRTEGEIYANLPDGAYTKDEEYEIWGNGSLNSIVYDFDGIDLTESSQLNNFIDNNEGWFNYKGKAMTSNPYDEYNIETTATFTGTDATNDGYGIYIQAQIDTDNNLDGYILQYDEGYGGLVIKKIVDSKELNDDTRIFLDTSELDITNNEWWENEHTIEINVTNDIDGSDKQNVEISIDDTVISDSYTSQYGGTAIAHDDLTINKFSDSDTNYTGIRTWNASKVNTTVEVDSVSITEL